MSKLTINMPIFNKVIYPYQYEQNKHDKGEGYAEAAINRMTNVELLQAISDALEERIKEVTL